MHRGTKCINLTCSLAVCVFWQVEKEQLDAIVENLREALMHDPTAKDEVLYSVMRRVYNRVDIEAQLDEDYTLTKVLYESNDVLITEASLQWKRYPQLAPIRIKVSGL